MKDPLPPLVPPSQGSPANFSGPHVLLFIPIHIIAHLIHILAGAPPTTSSMSTAVCLTAARRTVAGRSPEPFPIVHVACQPPPRPLPASLPQPSFPRPCSRRPPSSRSSSVGHHPAVQHILFCRPPSSTSSALVQSTPSNTSVGRALTTRPSLLLYLVPPSTCSRLPPPCSSATSSSVDRGPLL
jgi:hypothetical protein